MSDAAVTARLREACRGMVEPIVVRDVDDLTSDEITERIREALELGELCSALGESLP